MNQLNYYDVLEVSETASVEVIKAAYRALSKRYHPDTQNRDSLPKNIDMTLINEAYEVLSDEQKRKKYDETIRSQKTFSSQYQKAQGTQNAECKSQNGFTNSAYKYKDDTNKNKPENDDKRNDEEKETHGWFGKMVKNFSREMVRTMQDNSREIENAYLDGLAMDDYLLIKRFKQSSGYKRAGYSKALEEKGLLERNYEGKLVPTYRFKQMF